MEDNSFDPWECGIARGKMMLDFLRKEAGSLSGKSVLDLGCGYGGISMVLKESALKVCSLDMDIARLFRLEGRLSKSGVRGVFAVCSDVSELPFAGNSFDLVILNGVLEWAGYGKQEDPFLLQRKALREAFRVLKKGGKLYLAIENRFYPFNILKDPHVRLPLVAVLPFKLSNMISRLLSGRPYRTPLYSYHGLKRMVEEAGFHGARFYSGLLSYQYPSVVMNLDTVRKDLLTGEDIARISYDYKRLGLGRFLAVKVIFLKLILLFNVAKMFTHNFIVLSEK